jgi:hypothetical protein
MSENPRHDGPNFASPIVSGPLNGDDLPKSGAEATGNAWKLSGSDCGCSEGPSYDSKYEGTGGKTEGQIDIPFTVDARQDIPYQHDFHERADVNFAPDRVDVADPNPDGGVPALFHGNQGQPLPFDQVAPDHNHNPGPDLDGGGAPEASDTNAAAPGAPS